MENQAGLKASRNEMVSKRILDLIRTGVLKEGDRIPSIRQLSKELQVSINTVKDAYWKLESRNYIVAVPQSGFYVKKQPADILLDKAVDPRHLDPQDVSLCRIYGAFQNMGQCTPEISLAIASLDPDLRPTAKMGRFIAQALREHELESFSYLMTPGHIELRQQIARLGLSCGLELSPEQIVITNGCHEAVFLALIAVCQPGDTVVLESPIYFNLLQLLQHLKLKIIEIPSSDVNGMHLNTLRFVLENHSVKAVFSISNVNNPMGFSMPREKKKALVTLLDEYGIPLIEDDIYGDLGFRRRAHPCKSFDTKDNVLLCSSFSKTIAPGVRVGWIVPGKYYDPVVETKTLLNISTASMNQIAMARFLKDGGYERHLRSLRKTLSAQVTAMRAAILKYFPKGTLVSRPSGGHLLWIELPQGIDAEVIYHKAMEQDILIAPGHLFSIKPHYTHCMRLNAGMWNPRVEKAIQVIGALCEAELSSEGRPSDQLRQAV
ncbi:MAG: PLP-dependent aminotransferase family protein [Desulfobacteraceae bacterium]|jgi:DNA-binding transcriptional MocR family regulator